MSILLADDEPRVRSALRLLIEQNVQLRVAGEVDRGEGLLEAIQRSRANIVLLDWELPGFNGSFSLFPLRKFYPHLKVIVLSGHLEAQQEALHAGADAFISKNDFADKVLQTLSQTVQTAGLSSPI